MKRIAALVLLFSACGASTMTGRERAEYAESRSMTAERALDQAELALEELRADDAEPLIKDAKEALDDPDIVAYPEHTLLKDRASEAEKKLVEVRAEIARREFQQKIALQKTAVTKAVEAFQAALEPIKKPAFGRSEVDKADNAMSEVGDALEEGLEYSAKDQDYAAWAKEIANSLAKPREELAVARKIVDFKENTVERRRAAEEARDRAKGEIEPAKQRELYGEARLGFVSCEREASRFLSAEPELAKRKLAVSEDESISIDALRKDCAAEVKRLDKAIKKITAKEKAAAKKATKKAAPKKTKKKKR